LKKYAIDGEYNALAIAPEALADCLKSLPDAGYAGINLTLPHKAPALPLLVGVDGTARAIGAGNTVSVTNGKLYGTNTDCAGFIENLKMHGALTAGGTAVVLGAGGAARAVCKGLLDEGYGHILLTNRTREKAEAMAASFSGGITVHPW